MPTHHTEDEDPGVAVAFRGLADPYRLQVFAALRDLEQGGHLPDTGSRELPNVIESISRTTNISPDLVEHHLMELRRAGLVIIGEGPSGQAIITLDRRRMALVRQTLDPDPPTASG